MQSELGLVAMACAGACYNMPETMEFASYRYLAQNTVQTVLSIYSLLLTIALVAVGGWNKTEEEEEVVYFRITMDFII